MSIKKQLAAFYAKQGLTGKHRRKAMQWDMRQVRMELVRRPSDAHNLMYIHWGSMAQPVPGYWVRRHLCH